MVAELKTNNMARTSNSRGKKGFSQRSGKSPLFKMMGSSSPVRDTSTRTPHGHDHDDQGNEITWSKERLISEQRKETDIDITKTRQYQTEGISKGRPVEEISEEFGKPGSDICKEAARAGVPCAEYIKKKEVELGYKKKHAKGRKEEDVTPKEKKKCECQTYKADGSEGPMVAYPCGGPKNPSCSKRPTTKKCSCTPKGGEPITYDCNKAKPAACASKGSTPDCPDSKRTSCPGSSWSWKKCKCNKKPGKIKEDRYKKRCYKGKSGATICPDLSTSGPKGGGQEML